MHCGDQARNMVADTIDIKGTFAFIYLFIYLYFFLYLLIKWPTSDRLLMYIMSTRVATHLLTNEVIV